MNHDAKITQFGNISKFLAIFFHKMGNILNKGLILDRIKEAYGLSGNSELARFIGVAPNTISNWYNRNSIDFDLVFPKCENINFNWLLTGKGNMLQEEVAKKAEESPDIQIKPLADLLTLMHSEVKDLTSQLSMQISENKKLMCENEILRRKEKFNIGNFNNDEKEKLIEKEKKKDKPPIQSDRRVHSDDPNFTVEKSTR